MTTPAIEGKTTLNNAEENPVTNQEENIMPENETNANLTDSAEATITKKATRRKKFVDAEGYLLEYEGGPRKVDAKTGEFIMDKPRELAPRTVAKKLRGAIDLINTTIALGNLKGLKIELGLTDNPDAPLTLGPIKIEETF